MTRWGRRVRRPARYCSTLTPESPSVSSPRMDRWTCPHCRREFNQRTNLRRHQRSACPELFPIWPYACERGCGSRFYRPDMRDRQRAVWWATITKGVPFGAQATACPPTYRTWIRGLHTWVERNVRDWRACWWSSRALSPDLMAGSAKPTGPSTPSTRERRRPSGNLLGGFRSINGWRPKGKWTRC